MMVHDGCSQFHSSQHCGWGVWPGTHKSSCPQLVAGDRTESSAEDKYPERLKSEGKKCFYS